MKLQEFWIKISNIKKTCMQPISWIIKYDLNNYNISWDTFFNWIEKPTIIDINNEIHKFNIMLNDLKLIKLELINDIELSEVERKFLLNSLNSICLKIHSFRYSIFLEAEKLWYELTEKSRKFCLNKVNKLQDNIYWNQISDTPNEVIQIKNHLSKILEINKEKITNNEYEIFKLKLWLQDEIIDNKKQQDIEISILNKKFPWEIVKKLFDLLINIYWLDWWEAKIDKFPNFKTDSVNKKIILPEWKIEKINLKNILQLFDHEVWVHAIREYNTNLWLNLSWEWYLELEEWFAILSEQLFDENIENINHVPVLTHISNYIRENFNWNETLELLIIYFKLTNDENITQDEIYKKAFDRMLRSKRFYSLKDKWANRKDLSYNRGETDIIEYLKSENDIEWFIKKFYFAKLSKEDIDLSEEFSESLQVNKNDLKYPLWIWKIIYKKLLWEQIFTSNLKDADLRFQAIENLSWNVKRKILWLIELIKE